MENGSRSLLNSPLNSEPTTHLLTLATLAEDPEPDREEERDRLVIKLLFAARRLANSQIVYRPLRIGGEKIALPAVICSVCKAEQPLDQPPVHHAFCNAGEILETLAALESLLPDPEAAPVESGAYELKEPKAALYGEPWHSTSYANASQVCDREGLAIAWAYSNSIQERVDWAARIVACVNLCAGLDQETLTGILAKRAAEKGGVA